MLNTGQELIFLAFLFGGVVNGLIYEILYFLKLISTNFIYNLIVDILLVISLGLGLLFWAFLINYGEIRPYSVFSYLLGYFLLKKVTGKSFNALRSLLYNKIRRFFDRPAEPEQNKQR
ncbi:MAG TPA: spore cortex biosynthesis protein YabQ [Clostridia bacterium]